MSVGATAGPRGVSEDPIPLIPPIPVRVFEARNARLRALAPGHAVGPYLEAMTRLTAAQLAVLRSVTFEGKGTSDPAAGILLAPEDCDIEAWRSGLAIIISEMEQASLPEPSQAALGRLKASAPSELGSFARRILSGNYEEIDLAASPFLGAALQVYFTSLASRVRVGDAQRRGGQCPVCGSPPVAGVVLSGRSVRYLCCSLCAARWYVPRLTCVHCNSTAAMSYFTVDKDTYGAKAEACSQCRVYLKLFYLESNPAAEPDADDLATLALDLLVSEEGYSRVGANLLLLSSPGPSRQD